MTKEQLNEKFHEEIANPHDYFNHRGGLVNEVFDFFWKEVEELQAEVERLKGVNKQHIQVWKDVDEFVRNHKDTKLGDSVSGKALEMLKRVDRLESERDQWKARCLDAAIDYSKPKL